MTLLNGSFEVRPRSRRELCGHVWRGYAVRARVSIRMSVSIGARLRISVRIRAEIWDRVRVWIGLES